MAADESLHLNVRKSFTPGALEACANTYQHSIPTWHVGEWQVESMKKESFILYEILAPAHHEAGAWAEQGNPADTIGYDVTGDYRIGSAQFTNQKWTNIVGTYKVFDFRECDGYLKIQLTPPCGTKTSTYMLSHCMQKLIGEEKLSEEVLTNMVEVDSRGNEEILSEQCTMSPTKQVLTRNTRLITEDLRNMKCANTHCDFLACATIRLGTAPEGTPNTCCIRCELGGKTNPNVEHHCNDCLKDNWPWHSMVVNSLFTRVDEFGQVSKLYLINFFRPKKMTLGKWQGEGVPSVSSSDEDPSESLSVPMGDDDSRMKDEGPSTVAAVNVLDTDAPPIEGPATEAGEIQASECADVFPKNGHTRAVSMPHMMQQINQRQKWKNAFRRRPRPKKQLTQTERKGSKP